MLTITLVALVLAIPLSSMGSHGSTISATLYTRIVTFALVYAAALSYNSFPAMDVWPRSEIGAVATLPLDGGLGLYSGLIYASTITQSMEVFLLLTGALILLPWSRMGIVPHGYTNMSTVNTRWATIPEYPMIILFTTMGATFLLSSADLVSMYLSIELQSFGVYILAALYRDSESAAAAGLKYFLLGALSSALILLGSALVYSYTGLTNLDNITMLMTVPSSGEYTQAIILGFVIISIGLLFKVAAAPFHYWAPDVYDGTPTIVTTWLTVMPKISIFVFLLNLIGCSTPAGGNLANTLTGNISTNLLLISAFLSLIIGTVVGLGQYRIKRVLAYSTISHVGFLLLALAMSNASLTSGEESVMALFFYIVQYSLTNVNAFFVLLAFGYVMNQGSTDQGTSDLQFTSELQGQFRYNPVLGLSFAISLFSMAGVPPLVGFFAKYTVLYSAIHNGYAFLAIIAILASVVSAVYYLRIIRVIHFSAPVQTTNNPVAADATLTSTHSYVIAVLTLFIMLFAVYPTYILNSTSIMALSLYVT